MKVKISYTVDLDDVPKEIDFLIQKAEQSLGEAFDLISQLKDIKNQSIEKALEEVPKIRQSMMAADIVLDDCELILSGYMSAKYATPALPDNPAGEIIQNNED